MVSDIPESKGGLEVPDEISGLRMTRQRQEVYRLLMEEPNHPTANDVFMKVKDRLPNISLATVYNCLEALVQHDIVRQVNFERGPSRYCSNLKEHGHFHDSVTGAIHDVHFKTGVNLADFLDLPPGAIVEEIEITVRGQIAKQP